MTCYSVIIGYILLNLVTHSVSSISVDAVMM